MTQRAGGNNAGGPHKSPPRNRAEFQAQMKATRADIEAQVKATRAQIDATTEKIEARTGRNLILAVLIGLVLGVAMLFSLIVIKELFMVFGGVLIGFTAFELANALRHAGRSVPRIPTVIAALAIIPAAYYLDAAGQWLATLAGIVFVGLWRVAELLAPSRRTTGLGLVRDIFAGVFVQVYVAFLGSFAVLLVAQPNGQWWTLAFLILVIAVDTGAYAAGLSFGKHPMAPTISPKKTWEGFAGAAVVGIVGGVILAIFMLGQPWWVGVVFGVVILVTATFGDLSESLIKRDLGIKDMSSWLPGHGGFLDRLDSILPSAAATYVLFLLFS
ncbi:phosphatidate cytidylyltransferase [Compostimonas suwonensis]|uniref:Phosphatidate cytidylyltransferase n=1 Tax=Compostimonas suwonensis TaxID=1048394 RepID=A0A2M9BZS9_9MICO|nr:phosphatidate cytidylyltransferase [Compostimonas suwonensis]PJJ63576.1 phosphatidate cytidylyltransferase [Compostimonas suwonensis]